MKSRRGPIWIAGGAGLVVLVLLAALWSTGRSNRRLIPAVQPQPEIHSNSAAPRVRSMPTSVERTDARQPVKPSTSSRRMPLQAGPTPTPAPGEPVIETGPTGITRTFRHDFRQVAPPEKYFASLEGVEISPEGFRLAKQPDGNYPAAGIIQSVPFPTEMPVDSVGAHWMEKAPDGTDVKLEISSSSDGSNWTNWETVEPDSDSEVEPYFPDGRPNPSYGDVVGALISRSDNRAMFVRYRATLATEKPDATPLLQRVAFTYLDSTDQGTNMVQQQEPVQK